MHHLASPALASTTVSKAESGSIFPLCMPFRSNYHTFRSSSKQCPSPVTTGCLEVHVCQPLVFYFSICNNKWNVIPFRGYLREGDCTHLSVWRYTFGSVLTYSIMRWRFFTAGLFKLSLPTYPFKHYFLPCRREENEKKCNSSRPVALLC